MAVSPTSKTLNVGETVQLTGTKNPSTASEGTQWISSNTSVATVSNSGLVTAKSAGTATITFKNSASTKSATCSITVEKRYMASDINSSFYGQELKGYTCPSDGVSKWRIFYSDKTNIYLIADDYIHYTKAASLSSDYGWNVRGKPYILAVEGTNIASNDWRSCPSGSFYESYLSSRSWNSLYKGDKADWAKGGPSLNLYLSSYNETHNTNISYKVESRSDGYNFWQEVIYNNNLTIYPLPIVEDYNGIYMKQDTSKADAMMISQLSGTGNTDGIICVGKRSPYGLNVIPCIGTFSAGGSRPIVCLNSNTILHRNTDGSFSITY